MYNTSDPATHPKDGVIMPAPTKSTDFDRAYSANFTFWGDIRIPEEVKALVRQGPVRSVLELGCGVGRFSRYLAQQGLRATGIDFSPVAMAKARERVARDGGRPEFLVGDATQLDALSGPVLRLLRRGLLSLFRRAGRASLRV